MVERGSSDKEPIPETVPTDRNATGPSRSRMTSHNVADVGTRTVPTPGTCIVVHRSPPFQPPARDAGNQIINLTPKQAPTLVYSDRPQPFLFCLQGQVSLHKQVRRQRERIMTQVANFPW